MISLAVAPMSLAICSRAVSTACSASQPKEWLRLAALPNFAGEVGHHGFEHAGVERGGGVVVHVDGQRDACRHFNVTRNCTHPTSPCVLLAMLRCCAECY